MKTDPTDDFDLPDDVPPDLPPQVIVQAEDLHLGPAVAKPFGKSWAEQYGPQPPGPGLRALDFVIVALFAGTVFVIAKSWAWAIFS